MSNYNTKRMSDTQISRVNDILDACKEAGVDTNEPGFKNFILKDLANRDNLAIFALNKLIANKTVRNLSEITRILPTIQKAVWNNNFDYNDFKEHTSGYTTQDPKTLDFVIILLSNYRDKPNFEKVLRLITTNMNYNSASLIAELFRTKYFWEDTGSINRLRISASIGGTWISPDFNPVYRTVVYGLRGKYAALEAEENRRVKAEELRKRLSE